MTLPAKSDLIGLATTTQAYRDALDLFYDHVAALPLAGTSYTKAQADAAFLALAGGTLVGNFGITTDGVSIPLHDTGGGVNAKRLTIKLDGDALQFVPLTDAAVELFPVLDIPRDTTTGHALRIDFGVDGALAARITAAGTTLTDPQDLVTKEKAEANFAALEGLITEPGTAFTATLAYRGQTVASTSGSASTLTLPTDANLAAPVGFAFEATQDGAGTLSVSAQAGATLNGFSAGTGALTARYGRVKIFKAAADTWRISGDHGAVA